MVLIFVLKVKPSSPTLQRRAARFSLNPARAGGLLSSPEHCVVKSIPDRCIRRDSAVGKVGIIADDPDFLRIVRMPAGAENIMLPFGQVQTFFARFDPVPNPLPRFISLRESGDQPPVPAMDLFQKEQRKHCLDRIVLDTVQPFRVEKRPVEPFEIV